MAKKLLLTAGNSLSELGKQNVSQMQKVKGIGQAKAIIIQAAMEIGRRRSNHDVVQKSQIHSSKDVYMFFQPLMADLSHEKFWVLFLNRSHKVIEKMKVSQGGVAGTVIDVKLILKHAIEKLASAIVLCHNYPSGNLCPSNADIAITRKLVEAGKLMDINIIPDF